MTLGSRVSVGGRGYSGLGESERGGVDTMSVCVSRMCFFGCSLWSCWPCRIAELLTPWLTLPGRGAWLGGAWRLARGEGGWLLGFLHLCLPNTDRGGLGSLEGSAVT